MAEEHDYITNIHLVGKFDDKFMANIKKLSEGFGKVSVEAEKMGKEGKESCFLLEKGCELAREQIDHLKEAFMELAPELIGITAAFQVFTGVGETIKDAVGEAVKAREQISSLSATIAGTDLVKKHNRDPKEILEHYLGISEELAKKQGGLFAADFYTAIQAKLATGGVGPGKNSKALTEKLVNFTAMRNNTLNITAEQVNANAQLVDRALSSGSLGRLGSTFGLSTADAKRFKAAAAAGNQELELQIILAGTNFKKAQEYVTSMGNTADGALKKSKTATEEAMKALGNAWVGINESSEEGVSGINTAWLEILTDVGNVATALKGPIRAGLDKFAWGVRQVRFVGEWVYGWFQVNWTKMLNSGELDNYFNALKTGWAMVQSEFAKSGILGDIQKDFKELSTNKDLGDLVKTFKDEILPTLVQIEFWIVQRIIPSFKQMLAFDFGAIKVAIFALKVTFDILNDVLKLTKLLLDEITGHPDTTPELVANAKLAQANAITALPVEQRAGAQANADVHNAKYDAFLHAHGHAKGGITTGASVGLIGEAGPELIYPLTDPNVLGKSLEEAKKSNDANKHQLDQLVLMTTALQTIATPGFIGGGGMSGGGGAGGGDVPQGSMGGHTLGSFGYIGDGTPDSNSLKGVGAYSSHMIPGYSAGMSKGAQMKWGIRPGQIFTVGGHTFRLDDTDDSGGQLDYIDVYNPFHAPDPGHGGDANKMIAGHPESWWFAQRGMASGGIVSKATRTLLGESGPEAVIPLSGNSLAKHGLGGGFSPTFAPTIHVNAGDEHIAENVRDVLRREFESFMDHSYFEFQRRRLA